MNDNMEVRRRTNFTIIGNQIINDDRVTQNALTVYLAVAYHADRNGENAYPSFTTIAKKARISRRAAIDALSELVTLGYVLKEARTRKTKNGRIISDSNLYTVLDVPEAGVVQDLHQGSAGGALGGSAGPAPEQDSSRNKIQGRGEGEPPTEPVKEQEQQAEPFEIAVPNPAETIEHIYAHHGFSPTSQDREALVTAHRAHGSDLFTALRGYLSKQRANNKSEAPAKWLVGKQFGEHLADGRKMEAQADQERRRESDRRRKEREQRKGERFAARLIAFARTLDDDDAEEAACTYVKEHLDAERYGVMVLRHGLQQADAVEVPTGEDAAKAADCIEEGRRLTLEHQSLFSAMKTA